MLCTNCNENEATIRQTRVHKGVVQNVHLCEACAAEDAVGGIGQG